MGNHSSVSAVPMGGRVRVLTLARGSDPVFGSSVVTGDVWVPVDGPGSLVDDLVSAMPGFLPDAAFLLAPSANPYTGPLPALVPHALATLGLQRLEDAVASGKVAGTIVHVERRGTAPPTVTKVQSRGDSHPSVTTTKDGVTVSRFTGRLAPLEAPPAAPAAGGRTRLAFLS
jgi:hypothetical protein